MTLCIYHGNCDDGFAAAWAVRKALPDAASHAGVYQAPPPDVTDLDVVIVDISYKRPVLLEMADVARSILILDHHKTAQADLINLPDNVTCVFDMDQSGAMLAWKHFHGDREPPQLIRHIEDRDLWRFVLPHTREIHAAVSSYSYDFGVWDELMARSLPELIAEGTAIDRKYRKDLDELLSTGRREMLIGGYRVPVANLPHMFASDAGAMMAQGYPFAACYFDKPNERVFSLRSTDDGVDVSLVAEEFGGGGHRNASGFRIPHPRLIDVEYAVMVGPMDDDNDPAMLHVYDELASAEELAQYVPDSWIAERDVTVGDWRRCLDADPPGRCNWGERSSK